MLQTVCNAWQILFRLSFGFSKVKCWVSLDHFRVSVDSIETFYMVFLLLSHSGLSSPRIHSAETWWIAIYSEGITAEAVQGSTNVYVGKNCSGSVWLV